MVASFTLILQSSLLDVGHCAPRREKVQSFPQRLRKKNKIYIIISSSSVIVDLFITYGASPFQKELIFQQPFHN
jgi:hypothetical protein